MGIKNYIKRIFFPKQKTKSLKGLGSEEYVDAIFRNLIAEHKVPGISVTLLQKGKVVLQKGYGCSDLDNKTAVSPKETIFRIASISKCITGLAFGKMVEEGILGWDDSFYKHVPDYPKKKHDFTLRQLASHTAGIRGYRGKEFALNRPFSIKESIEVFKDDPLVFQPGQGYLYNSFDFVLLSLAMQEASGIPFEDYVREKVLHPLGMENTFAPECHLEQGSMVGNAPMASTALSLPRTKFYSKRSSGFKKAVEVNNFYKLAGGGYLSTSHDIATFGQAILEQRLLKKDTYNKLLKDQMVNGKSTYYGLGFQVSQDAQSRAFVGHVGNSVGAYTNLFVYPSEKVVVSILMNYTNPNVQEELDMAIRALF